MEKNFEYEGEKVRIEKDKIVEIFRIFCEKDVAKKDVILPVYRNYLVSENVLFIILWRARHVPRVGFLQKP